MTLAKSQKNLKKLPKLPKLCGDRIRSRMQVSPLHTIYRLCVSHWLWFQSRHTDNFHLALVTLWGKVCHCPAVPCRRLTSYPADTLSVTFFFKYLPTSLDSTSLLVSISRWLVWGTYSQETGSWCFFSVFYFLKYSRYIACHLQSNKIKITTLNLRAMLLISTTPSSLLSAEIKPKGVRQHKQISPFWGISSIVILFDLCVQYYARHHGGFRDV